MAIYTYAIWYVQRCVYVAGVATFAKKLSKGIVMENLFRVSKSHICDGKTTEEYLKNLEKVFQRLKEGNLV